MEVGGTALTITLIVMSRLAVCATPRYLVSKKEDQKEDISTRVYVWSTQIRKIVTA